MSGYRFTVEVVTDTQEHADQVMADRLGFDDPYIDANGQAFDYLVDWVTA